MGRHVDAPLQTAHLYFKFLSDELSAKKKRELYRDRLKDYISENCEPDENGNLTYEFPQPLFIDDIWYSGLQNQRRVSEYTDEDKAMELISRHGLEDRCLIPVVTTEIDLDELYAANQEGIISDDEIDSIINAAETWALVKVKK